MSIASAGELRGQILELKSRTEDEERDFRQSSQETGEQKQLLASQDERVQALIATIGAAVTEAEDILGTAKKISDADETLAGRISQGSSNVDDIHRDTNETLGETRNDYAIEAMEHLASASNDSGEAVQGMAEARQHTKDSVDLAGKLHEGLKELLEPAEQLGELAVKANAAMSGAQENMDSTVGHTHEAAQSLEAYAGKV